MLFIIQYVCFQYSSLFHLIIEIE